MQGRGGWTGRGRAAGTPGGVLGLRWLKQKPPKKHVLVLMSMTPNQVLVGEQGCRRNEWTTVRCDHPGLIRWSRDPTTGSLGEKGTRRVEGVCGAAATETAGAGGGCPRGRQGVAALLAPPHFSLHIREEYCCWSQLLGPEGLVAPGGRCRPNAAASGHRPGGGLESSAAGLAGTEGLAPPRAEGQPGLPAVSALPWSCGPGDWREQRRGPAVPAPSTRRAQPPPVLPAPRSPQVPPGPRSPWGCCSSDFRWPERVAAGGQSACWEDTQGSAGPGGQRGRGVGWGRVFLEAPHFHLPRP